MIRYTVYKKNFIGNTVFDMLETKSSNATYYVKVSQTLKADDQMITTQETDLKDKQGNTLFFVSDQDAKKYIKNIKKTLD
jgi:hypothetical protein